MTAGSALAPTSLSVLMPTWNGAEFLDRVVVMLSAQQLDLPWEFLAIDSGSTDGTLDILTQWQRRFPVPLRVLQIHPTAFDHGDTRNMLAAESTGDLLVFLTQDAIPTSAQWLKLLIRNFEDPRVGAAYCRNVHRPDAHLLTRVFSENDPGYARARREQKLPARDTYATMSPHEKRLLFNLNDVAAAYRRELWERHPFPRTTFGEDVLMARALIEAGYTVVYDDVATVEHSHDYGPAEMRARARIDGRFNAEWLDRICVATRGDAAALTKRQLARDRAALVETGITGAALTEQLKLARAVREAAFVGLYEGGRTRARRASTRMRDSGLLRILYVVHGFPPDTWAGTEVYTLGLALEMQKRGHEVAILTRAPGSGDVSRDAPRDFDITADEVQGLRVWRMTNRLRHENLRDTYHQPRAEAAFREVVLEFRPDVVHFQHLLHLSATLPHVCRELGVASVVTVNDYWALCARVQLIRPDGVRCAQNQGLGCLLCVKEGPYTMIPAARKLLPLLAPAAAVLRRAGSLPGLTRVARIAGEYSDIASRHEFVTDGYAACDLAIAPSRFLRERLLETGRFKAHHVIYSDYGTLTDHVHAIPRRTSAAEGIRFGFVGSLLWYKGVDVLITAMSRLADVNAVLHIHGDYRPESDPYHATLAQLAEACAGNVIFHGRFDNRELARVYQTFDALVVPSTWFENSPITIHESFLFRTPVIASDIGGMAELVRDGADGLHFRAGDADDLASKLRQLATDTDLLGRLTEFRHVASMAEDARSMEARYRALACVVREPGPRVLLDRPAWPPADHHGPVEQQGDGVALLRPGGAWAEYDIRALREGDAVLEIDTMALGMETNVPIGGTVSVDGVEVGRMEPFAANGQDQVRRFSFPVDLGVRPRRVRVDTHTEAGEVFMRIVRIRVLEAGPAPAPRQPL
jgi:glycosyltransferase involved in cell wall biosynthesis